ncbi:hypothetical protein [Nocardia mangyaensis]|uniref:hypothetical protein n=1 Tax=Nocardia mangyaensis TaxID=2213200 RepID=UPI00267586CB|nr:hypothetical protein [Nocardia mangyaensis]MDO3648246.1 hypothetical protein [Nocardia mangyaensis]
MSCVVLLTFVPGAVGAAATAQPGAMRASASVNSGLGWMDIRDTSGVPLAEYLFATDHGSLLNPGNGMWALLITLEFAGYMVIVTTAIWLVGYVLSFRWLDLFAGALTGVADGVAAQLATPTALLAATTIGAVVVAYLLVRGFPARAAAQTVAMFTVSVLGPLLLAEPLAAVLSSDGILVHGRDVGLSVAAGLNGDRNPEPGGLIVTVQGDLADNFARRPLQVWNFGHVVDGRNSCRVAWSSGIRSGEVSAVADGIRDCGDSAAHAAIVNPGAGQLGTGLSLLAFGTVLLAFAAYLGVQIIRSALNAVYQGFLAIFGFAAGGFVYGPTQTFLIRNIVDIGVAAARMVAYTVFLGVYVLFLGNLFRLAGDQVMAVLIIGGVVEIVAIWQLRRLRRGLDRGATWIANRVALAAQGSSPAGPGSSDRMALGMGTAGARNSLPAGAGGLAALTVISMSPATAWLAGKTRNPLSPYAWKRKRAELARMEYVPMSLHRQQWLQANRDSWTRAARVRAEKHGGAGTPLAVAEVIDALMDAGIPKSELNGVLTTIGALPDDVLHADRALAVQNASMSQNDYVPQRLRQALAAWESVNNHPVEPQREVREHLAFAARARIAARKLARDAPGPGAGAGTEVDAAFVDTVRRHWDSPASLRTAVPANRWRSVGAATRHVIGTEAAAAHSAAVARYYDAPTAANRVLADITAHRIATLGRAHPDAGPGPWDH